MGNLAVTCGLVTSCGKPETAVENEINNKLSKQFEKVFVFKEKKQCCKFMTFNLLTYCKRLMK